MYNVVYCSYIISCHALFERVKNKFCLKMTAPLSVVVLIQLRCVLACVCLLHVLWCWGDAQKLKPPWGSCCPPNWKLCWLACGAKVESTSPCGWQTVSNGLTTHIKGYQSIEKLSTISTINILNTQTNWITNLIRKVIVNYTISHFVYVTIFMLL